MRFTVVGAGGIGGPLGAQLIESGHEVTFVESNPAHAAAIRERGLHVSGHAELQVTPAAVVAPQALRGPLEMVLLAVKSRDTEIALSAISPHLARDGCVVSLQNGL